ncbi:MAG TPA: MFS transporter [Thermomicrobiaceae bacterium]|nr:MFS transporter [Thermomicrobiaceae bacterium]
MLPVLRQRDFFLLWLGGLISLLGDRAMRVALPVYVYQQTGSTLATAAMAASYYLPAVLLGSLAGVFTDRWDRRRVMIGANFIQAGVILLLLLVRSADWLWLVYLVSFTDTAVSLFVQPAQGALIPNLVDEEQFVPANALGALGTNLGRLAGPPVGGVLIGLFGLGSVALVDGASFLLAATLFALISVTRKPAPEAMTEASRIGLWREWREGLALVRRDRLIAALFVVLSVTSFGGAMIDPLIAPFVLSVLRRGPATLGWLPTVGAAGGIVAGLLIGRIGRRFQPRRLVGAGTVLTGLLMVALYNQTWILAVAALWFVLSLPVVAANVGAQTLLQAGVPDRYRGRVYGALNTAMAMLSLGSVALSGALAEVVGVVAMLSVAGGVTIVAGLLALLLLPSSGRSFESAGGDRPAQVGVKRS